MCKTITENSVNSSFLFLLCSMESLIIKPYLPYHIFWCFFFLLGIQGPEALCHSNPEAKGLHAVATTTPNLHQRGRIRPVAVIHEGAITQQNCNLHTSLKIGQLINLRCFRFVYQFSTSFVFKSRLLQRNALGHARGPKRGAPTTREVSSPRACISRNTFTSCKTTCQS